MWLVKQKPDEDLTRKRGGGPKNCLTVARSSARLTWPEIEGITFDAGRAEGGGGRERVDRPGCLRCGYFVRFARDGVASSACSGPCRRWLDERRRKQGLLPRKGAGQGLAQVSCFSSLPLSHAPPPKKANGMCATTKTWRCCRWLARHLRLPRCWRSSEPRK